MAEVCAICGKNEMTLRCEICQVPLCDLCFKEVGIEESSPGYRVKGVAISSMRSPVTKRKVCPTCFREADLL